MVRTWDLFAWLRRSQQFWNGQEATILEGDRALFSTSTIYPWTGTPMPLERPWAGQSVILTNVYYLESSLTDCWADIHRRAETMAAFGAACNGGRKATHDAGDSRCYIEPGNGQVLHVVAASTQPAAATLSLYWKSAGGWIGSLSVLQALQGDNCDKQ